jgi:spermidine synthase
MSPSPKSTLAGIFCLGLSIILFEIALTRVFAIMMWHHFTYMVISIGLLGFGASGSLLTATRIGSGKQSPVRGLVWCSLCYGVSVMLAFCFATLVRIDSLAIWQQKENFLALFLIYLIIGVPFLLGGFGIGLALTRLVEHVNKLYFSDLVGSSVGAGLSVLLMKAFGSSATVMMAGVFGLLAAFCFSLGAPRRYLALSVPGLVLAGIVALAFTGGAPSLGIAAASWRVPYAPGKEALVAESLLREVSNAGLLGGQSPELTKIYSATAEVEVGASIEAPPMIGGDQGLVDQRLVESRAVGQDGTAPTMLFKQASDLSRFPFLDDTQAATAYVVHRASGRKEQDVMVIGVGGGVDVMTALANGARKVTAVELNTAMIEMVKQRYDDYLGGLFRPGGHALADRVSLVNSEGRAWLRSHDDSYDVIQMSGVDSYTALSTGAYTLSESYLYTTEAVQDFYHHLKENGIVTYSRFIEAAPTKPRETLRLANIACTALRELAVPDPASHIAVFQGLAWASTMVKKQPFTAVEIEALRDFACRQGFVGLVFDPTRSDAGGPEATHFASMRKQFLAAMAKAGGFASDPAVQNEQVFALMQAAVRVAKSEPVADALLPPAMQAAGLAPRALEVLTALRADIVQQAHYVGQAIADFRTVLRGSDDERARFIAEYDYDILPATDDRPFFFNYYRWSSLWGAQRRVHDPSLFAYHTDFPVGHMVLAASLVQIMLLAGLLILLPLRKLASDGLETPGAWRYFGYFAALGLGFMLIEIALMQKLVIFLGHPTYALSVVLVSLLASAGTGSLLAGRIAVVERRHLRWILLAIVAVVVFDLVAIDLLLPLLLGKSLGVRVLVVVLLLIPTGLVLGMPFPSGMRVVEAQCPHLLPWGWAVNAFFSVFGSIFCIVLSMAIGFTNVLLAAIVVYGIGLLGMKPQAAPAPAVP